MKKIKMKLLRLKARLSLYRVDIFLLILDVVLWFMFPKVLIWVNLGLLVLYLAFLAYKWWSTSQVGKVLKNNNVHIFGFRRTGKDLTTQNYIKWRFASKFKKIVKREKLLPQDYKTYFNKYPLYLSLTDYGYGGKVVDIKEFELRNKISGKYVTYDDFINGYPIQCDKKAEYEGLDLIISEAQLGLPNTEHNTLDKRYPWLPVFIALAGHLYNMNIIINSQEFERPWIKIRNQQDFYVRAIKTFPYRKGFIARISPYLPFFRKYLITKVRIYEQRASAENNILPFNAKTIITESGKDVMLTSGQATKEQFIATNGVIRDYYLFTKIADIRYDTRVYHQTIFGYPIN